MSGSGNANVRCRFGTWLLLLSLQLAGVSSGAADGPVTVSADCSRIVDGPLNLWGYVNVSRRAPPPVELCERIEREYGRPEVTRCWLMLDQMWDYRTDTYRFNYEINKDYYQGDPNKKRYGVPGTTTGLHYYDYLDSVSGHSETVLMNIRRYEQEVLTGMITLEKWKDVFKSAVRHYKQRCPNLRYIEVLNEPTAKNQSNLGKIEDYYAFYRQAYEAVNELNAELRPELPLLVGGNSGFRTTEAIELIRDFASDPNPEKRLDFVSFHHYWIQKTPAQIAQWESEIDRALAAASLPTDLPIYVTEIGYANQWKDDPQKNLWQAAGMTAFQYYARHAPDLRLFPWVQYHSPAQIAFAQFDTRLRMTPFGAAVKMLTMHKSKEIAATSSGLNASGNGLGVLATMDPTGLAIQLWNLQPAASLGRRADVTVINMPAALQNGNLRIRRYQIDSRHSNCLAIPGSAGGLEMVDESTQSAGRELRLTADLEPMALVLWTVERQD
ncbi:MAG: cellulase family glycosylhydrolase [Planctomycetes bacterium]|nr:cellulase family glycosylhydrolase [Planctomycetota bacterium]